MRIKPGTYIATAARLGVLGLALLAGCGGGAKAERAPAGALTVYVSVPRHGVEARVGESVAAGARLALADAQGRAGDREVRLVELDDSKPLAPTWDPAAVEANARRAAADPTTIAYIGELDQGGSAVSVPVTNDNGLLQVSPADGLTTLTRDQPGAVKGTGPARYYPNGRRTFLRLVPNDALQAAELVRWARERGAQRLAVIQDARVFGRALAQQVANSAERQGLTVIGPLEPRDDPMTLDDFALKLAQQQQQPQQPPDAVVYTGLGDPNAGLLLAAVERALPGVPLYGSSALATAAPAPAGLPPVAVLSPFLPPSRYGPRARRLLARLPARPLAPAGATGLYGYEAMRVVLDALRASGRQAGDRVAVARAALVPRVRKSAIGDYRVLSSGDVSTARFGAYRRSATQLRYLGERGAAP
jgi:branched-chain amino acid transport system substrate-binding protein